VSDEKKPRIRVLAERIGPIQGKLQAVANRLAKLGAPRPRPLPASYTANAIADLHDVMDRLSEIANEMEDELSPKEVP
jgi:hypothetical protein